MKSKVLALGLAFSLPVCSGNLVAKESGAVWTFSCISLVYTSFAGQDYVSPLPGARLRVTAPSVAPKRFVGTLVEVTENDLVLTVSESERKAVPRKDLTRLEWSRGRHGNAVKGMLFGAAIGAVTISVVNAQDPETGETGEYLMVALIGACMGALPGAGIGALIKTEKWAELPLSNLRLTLGPVSGGRLIIGLAWKW